MQQPATSPRLLSLAAHQHAGACGVRASVAQRATVHLNAGLVAENGSIPRAAAERQGKPGAAAMVLPSRRVPQAAGAAAGAR
jgi:hypothetical protein